MKQSTDSTSFLRLHVIAAQIVLPTPIIHVSKNWGQNKAEVINTLISFTSDLTTPKKKIKELKSLANIDLLYGLSGLFNWINDGLFFEQVISELKQLILYMERILAAPPRTLDKISSNLHWGLLIYEDVKIRILNSLIGRNRLKTDMATLKRRMIYYEPGDELKLKKIEWYGKANSFITIFFDLLRVGVLTGDKQVMAKYIMNNFCYVEAGVKRDFNFDYTYNLLKKSSRDRTHHKSNYYINILKETRLKLQ